MGGKTSAASKHKYNSKAYDRIAVTVRKGQKEIIQQRAAQEGKSINGYINDLIANDLDNSSKDGD